MGFGNLVHMHTFLVSYLILITVSSVVLTQLWLQNRDQLKGPGCWLTGFLFQMFGLFLISGQNHIPLFLSVITGNTLIVLSSLFFYSGFLEFIGEQPKRIPWILIPGTFILFHIYFTYYSPDLRMRIVNVSLATSAVSFLSVIQITGNQEAKKLKGGTAAVIALITLTILNGARAVYALMNPPANESLLKQNDLFHLIFFLSMNASFLLLAFGFFILVNQRLSLRLKDEIAAGKKTVARLEALAQNLPGALFDIEAQPDADLKFLFLSRGAAEIFDQSNDQILHESFDYSSFVHPEDLEGLRIQILNSDISHGIFQTEFRIITPAGKIKWIELTARPNPDAGGEGPVWSGYLQDITEKKSHLLRIEESESRFRFISDNMVDVAWILDAETMKFTFVSPSVYDSRGFTPEEVIAMPAEESISAFARGTSSEDLKKIIEKFINSGISEIITAETPLTHRNGSIVWAEIIAKTVRNPLSGSVEIHGVSRNITKRKKTEEALTEARNAAEAASRAKSDFLANMSHELRTPLNGIIGTIQLLQDSDLNTEQKDLIRAAASSSETLFALINDLLDFSKIEAGQITFEKSQFSLNNVLSEVENHFRQTFSAKGLQFTVTRDRNLPLFLTGDPLRIKQILLNLLSNALKFTPSGQVELQVTSHENPEAGSETRIIFSVKDTGIGMKSEVTDKIFQPFVQENPGTARKYGGTGLGLSITKKLTELMGGTIFVSSDPGKGSVFSVSLPFTALQGKPEMESEQQLKSNQIGSRHWTGPSLRILVAEDQEINLLLIRKILTKAGHAVITAENGIEALEKLKTETPDLILMDVQMPEMDGIEATQKIRLSESESQKEKRLPIIALTAHAMNGYREQMMAEGFDGYVAKPLSITELYKEMIRVLGHD